MSVRHPNEYNCTHPAASFLLFTPPPKSDHDPVPADATFEALPKLALSVILRKLNGRDRWALAAASADAYRLTTGPDCEPEILGEVILVLGDAETQDLNRLEAASPDPHDSPTRLAPKIIRLRTAPWTLERASLWWLTALQSIRRRIRAIASIEILGRFSGKVDQPCISAVLELFLPPLMDLLCTHAFAGIFRFGLSGLWCSHDLDGLILNHETIRRPFFPFMRGVLRLSEDTAARIECLDWEPRFMFALDYMKNFSAVNVFLREIAVDDYVILSLSGLTRLRSLSVSAVRPSTTIHAWGTVLENLASSLTELRFDTLAACPASRPDVFRALTTLTNLGSLSLYSLRDLKALPSTLSMPSLTSLRLSTEDAALSPDLSLQLPSLVELRLIISDALSSQAEGCPSLSAALEVFSAACPRVTRLFLSFLLPRSATTTIDVGSVNGFSRLQTLELVTRSFYRYAVYALHRDPAIFQPKGELTSAMEHLRFVRMKVWQEMEAGSRQTTRVDYTKLGVRSRAANETVEPVASDIPAPDSNAYVENDDDHAVLGLFIGFRSGLVLDWYR